MNTQDKLFAVLAELLKIDSSKLSLETKAQDIETWDSLAVINIALALESEFDLALTPEQIAEFYNVRYIYDLIEESNS